MTKTDLIQIRPYKPKDNAFIISTWLDALRYGNSGEDQNGQMIYSWFGAMPHDLYRIKFAKIFNSMLENPQITTDVMSLREDEDTIIGYIISEPLKNMLHWVFVRHDWRGIGLAKMMMPAKVDIITFLTFRGYRLNKMKLRAEFNPFLI